MGKGDVGPIEIPRLGDHVAASPDERGEHLMLLEAARNVLETEWIETLAVSDASEDHAVWGYTSTVAYIKDRCGISGSRANRYVKLAKAARSKGLSPPGNTDSSTLIRRRCCSEHPTGCPTSTRTPSQSCSNGRQ